RRPRPPLGSAAHPSGMEHWALLWSTSWRYRYAQWATLTRDPGPASPVFNYGETMLRSPLIVALLAPTALALAATQWAPSTSGLFPAAASPSTVQAKPARTDTQTAEVIRLAVAQTGNEARYRIQERLAGMDLPYDAVGVTPGVKGEILLG